MKKLLIAIFLLISTSNVFAQSNVPIDTNIHVYFDEAGKCTMDTSTYFLMKYNVSLLPPHMDLVGPFVNFGPIPIGSVKELLQKAKRGDKLFFEDITVKNKHTGKIYIAHSLFKKIL